VHVDGHDHLDAAIMRTWSSRSLEHSASPARIEDSSSRDPKFLLVLVRER